MLLKICTVWFKITDSLQKHRSTNFQRKHGKYFALRNIPTICCTDSLTNFAVFENGERWTFLGQFELNDFSKHIQDVHRNKAVQSSECRLWSLQELDKTPFKWLSFFCAYNIIKGIQIFAQFLTNKGE